MIVVDKERTLIADLSAATAYEESHIDKIMGVLDSAKFIYVTAYFINSSMSALIKTADYANSNDVPFGFNFSAVYLQDVERDNFLRCLEASDYVFANEDEAAEFI